MSTSKSPLLTVKNLSVEFDGHKILDNISFSVAHDDTMAIIGPNGAGKTVLFKCLLGLLPHSGEVKWAKSARIGYVPQKLYVGKDVPITVGEFLATKEPSGKKQLEAMERVGFAPGSAEIAHSGERLLGTRLGVLSGGELQRVLIAYALFGDPTILLFDEPTSGVDISAEETVYHLISSLKREKDLAIVFISHELEVVYRYAAKVLCLNKVNVCFGPPREVIDKESLEKLYGEDIHFYEHDHSTHH